jgi:outer membrane protein assembly factor BamB
VLENRMKLNCAEVCLVGGIIIMTLSSVFAEGVSIGNPEWPMFMHDLHHTGYTEGLGPLDDNILWVYDFGSPLYSSPVVKNGVVYQGSREYLCALDMNTGALLWKTELAVVGSTPAVNKDIVVAATNKGICAINIRTGDILWEYDLIDVSNVSFPWMWEYYISSPVIVDGRVLVGSGTNIPFSFSTRSDSEEFMKLLCLDNYGELIWSKGTMEHLSTSPCIQGDTIYFTSGLVEAVDLESGTEKWSEASNSFLPSDPTFVEGGIIFSNPKGITLLDAHSGNLVWKQELELATSCMATDGTKLVGATATSLICVDVDTGSIAWEKVLWEKTDEPTDFPKYPSPAIARDRIYIGSRNGVIYCVELEDGTLLWEYDTGSPVVASPAVVNEKLFIGSTNGTLYCFGTIPEEYYEKAEEYREKGNTERAREFYLRAKDYYESQGNLEMVKKCEDKLREKNYVKFFILFIACICIGALITYKKMHNSSR